MRYKSAEAILLQISGDERAPWKVRLAALKLLMEPAELPKLKGYKSGSRENLLLRLASDSRAPGRDRFNAVCTLLNKKKAPTEEKAVSEPEPDVTGSPQSL